MAGWNRGAFGGSVAPKAPTPAPKNAAESIAAQNAAKRQSAANAGGKPRGNYGGGNVAPTPAARYYHNEAAQANPNGSSISNEIYDIMAKSGSIDPSDPYNWKGIAAGLAAQQSSGGGGGGGSYSGGGGGGGAVATPMAAQAPSVMQAPTSITTPPQAPAPVGITAGAESAPGAPVGANFTSLGSGGTFGEFNRMRNQRSPRTGLSITPEMLRRQASARLGSG